MSSETFKINLRRAPGSAELLLRLQHGRGVGVRETLLLLNLQFGLLLLLLIIIIIVLLLLLLPIRCPEGAAREAASAEGGAGLSL